MSLAGSTTGRRDTRAIPMLVICYIHNICQSNHKGEGEKRTNALLGEMRYGPLNPSLTQSQRFLSSSTYLNFIITVMNWYIFCFAFQKGHGRIFTIDTGPTMSLFLYNFLTRIIILYFTNKQFNHHGAFQNTYGPALPELEHLEPSQFLWSNYHSYLSKYLFCLSM